jgi:hypothetical protein
VGVHLNVFAHLVRNAVKAHGMPSARQAFVPTPLMNTAPAVLREYVEGDDPVHARPFMAEVFDQLTRPVPAGELRGEDWDRSTPRYVEASSEEELHALFQERRYTDFLPIVLPTEERVAQMLTGTSHVADEMVGKLRPTIGMEYWHFDVEKVAVNAVMAGAAPEHFPVLLALASSGDTGRQSSMSSMGNMVVVNGPIRHEIGMNSGIGALGPYNYANSVIGRASVCSRRTSRAARYQARRIAARRAATSPTTASRSPRTRRRAPGSRTTRTTATTGTRAPSPCRTSGGTSGPSTCARTGRRSCRR